MSILLCIHYRDRAGELRTVFDGVPRCAGAEEIPTAIAPALARIRREGGSGVRVDVVDDVTARCLATLRPKNFVPANNVREI